MTEKVEALFRGDFLESFDDDWVVATRSRLSAVRIQNQTLMARCFLLQDDYLQLENCARGLLQVDDLREETHCLLLQALAGQGRSVEAIAHFEAANEMFDNEIGVEPIRLRQTLKELGLLL